MITHHWGSIRQHSVRWKHRWLWSKHRWTRHKHATWHIEHCINYQTVPVR